MAPVAFGKCFSVFVTCITAASTLVSGAIVPKDPGSSDLDKRFNRHDAQYLTSKTSKYFVAGERIPEMPFDVGESYAGLMRLNPNATAAEMQKMFFWFFPTVNPAGKDDFVIWFNGGPGCSSLEGLIQENGPFVWRPGTYRPIQNAYSWHKLANVIWVEYPIGTGFSSGPITANDNNDTAEQFVLFWKNFMQTFDFNRKNIYLTGESYAGVHVPYVGSAMLEQNDTDIYNVKGAMIFNGVMPGSDGLGHDQRSLPSYVRHWGNVFGLPPSIIDQIDQIDKSCGLTSYLDQYLTYPPPSAPFPGLDVDECDALTPFFDAVNIINPCFNEYHIIDTCPIQWDVLGYPNMPYIPEGAHIWLNEILVRRILGVPEGGKEWTECSSPVYAGDGTDKYNNTEHATRFRTVIERTNNVIVGSGQLDMVIQPNVTTLALQMLEWNGKQGFQTAPSDQFLLPVTGANASDIPNLSGLGYQGSVHTDRGLTHVTINLSGHMIPQYASAAALRNLEVLLGRVGSFSSGDPFSIGLSTKFTWPF